MLSERKPEFSNMESRQRQISAQAKRTKEMNSKKNNILSGKLELYADEESDSS